MAKPDARHTAEPRKRKTPSKRTRLKNLLARYAELHPQDDAGRGVLDRLAADPDRRVSAAFAAILAPDDPGFWLIFATLQAASLARDHALIAERHKRVTRENAEILAALDTVGDWLNGFGDVRVPRLGVHMVKSARDDALLIADARDVVPRLRALATGLADAGDQLFGSLPISRKRRVGGAPAMSALRHLIVAIRAHCGAPHERHATALVEAALAIDQIAEATARRASRPR